ncbi:MAG: lytic murein transglycosylase [Acidimicrobiales bacterium]
MVAIATTSNHPWRGLLVAPALALGVLGCGSSPAAAPLDRATTTTAPTTTAAPTSTTASTTTLAPTTTTTIPEPLAVALTGRPRAAADPVGLAAQLTAAEQAIRNPATAPDVVAAAGHLQQVAYRQLGIHPEWDAEVMARLPPEVVEPASLNVQSRREFRSMHVRLRDTLPAWRIVAPEPAPVLLALYQEAAATFGVGWEYLAAINLVETGLGRIRGTSVAGAQGPMQFMPATWAAYGAGGDINSTRDSIMAAARYLAANGFANPGGIDGALFAYNRHPAYVRGVAAIARVIELDPQAFAGYYHWEIYYLTTMGDVLLPVGYEATAAIPVADYLAAHPQ